MVCLPIWDVVLALSFRTFEEDFFRFAAAFSSFYHRPTYCSFLCVSAPFAILRSAAPFFVVLSEEYLLFVEVRTGEANVFLDSFPALPGLRLQASCTLSRRKALFRQTWNPTPLSVAPSRRAFRLVTDALMIFVLSGRTPVLGVGTLIDSKRELSLPFRAAFWLHSKTATAEPLSLPTSPELSLCTLGAPPPMAVLRRHY